MINDPGIVRRVLSSLSKLGRTALHAAACEGRGSIKKQGPLCLVHLPWKMTGVILLFFNFWGIPDMQHYISSLYNVMIQYLHILQND